MNKPKPEDFYDPSDPRGMSTSEYDDYQKSIIDWGLHLKFAKEDPSKIITERRQDLGLINYEGDVLKLRKDGGEYVIYDQWDSLVEILNFKKFCEWLDGSFALVDSKGKEWVFTEQHREARQKMFTILEYVFFPSK